MSAILHDPDTFVVGKLPPNTVLVVKRDPEQESEDSRSARVGELKKQEELQLSDKADLSDQKRALLAAESIRKAAAAPVELSSEVPVLNLAREIETPALSRPDSTELDISGVNLVDTIA